MHNNAHNADHHHNPSWSWTKWCSQPRQQQQQQQPPPLPYNTSSSSQPVDQRSSSYRCQIETKSTQWQQSQEKTTRSLQPRQQQTSLVSDRRNEQQCPLDDFDSIKEEDLENLQKELELEEKKQYELLKQLREEQLKYGNPAASTQGHRRTYVEQTECTEVFKQYESNEEVIQYDIILKELEECKRLVEAQLDSLKEFEKNKQRPLKKIAWYKVNQSQPRQYQEDQCLLLIQKQKEALLMKLQRIKANQSKTKQIIDLVHSRSKTKKLHVTIRKSFYEMTVTSS